MTAAPYVVVPDGGGTSYAAVLTGAQADGRACLLCGTDCEAKVPVGYCYPADPVVPRWGGVQVFACTGGCVQVFAAVTADAADADAAGEVSW